MKLKIRANVLNLDLLNKWINEDKNLSDFEKSKLSEICKESFTKALTLERIYSVDPGYRKGERIYLNCSSFSRIPLSKGNSAGTITWKSSDKALAKILNPSKGLDLPYEKLKDLVGASKEKETLVTGFYQVKDITFIPEPGTKLEDGYRVKQYILEESF